MGVTGLLMLGFALQVLKGTDGREIAENQQRAREAFRDDFAATTTALVLWAGTPLEPVCATDAGYALDSDTRQELRAVAALAELSTVLRAEVDDVMARCADEVGAVTRVEAVVEFVAPPGSTDDLCLALELGVLTGDQFDALAHAPDPGNLTAVEQDAADALVAACRG
jgi:hypothetical protein